MNDNFLSDNGVANETCCTSHVSLTFKPVRVRPINALLVIAAFFCASALADGPADGYYTDAQVQRGQQVYSAHCAKCHGAELQGQAGPALAGSAFKGSLEYSKMSAPQLFSFISSQMPNDDPGSLTKSQYIDVLAYILKKNGYPAGKTALSQTDLDRIKLLPYPQDKHR